MSHQETRRQMKLLSPAEISSALGEDLSNKWEKDGDALRRVVKLGAYKQALELFKRVVEIAERNEHHPDITWSYTHVCVRLTTHDLGGISNLDAAVAKELEAAISEAGF